MIQRTGARGWQIVSAMSALFVALLLWPANAIARGVPDPWVVGTVSLHGRDYSVLFVDAARIERTSSGTKRAWVTVYYAPDAPPPVNLLERFQMLSEFDCQRGRSHILQSTSYYRSETTPFTANEPTEWSFVAPGSSGEGLQAFVCGTEETRKAGPNNVRLPANVSMLQVSQAVFANRPPRN